VDIESKGLSGVRFDLLHGDERATVYSRLPGRAMVHNALAAAAAGIVHGIDLQDIAVALSEAQIRCGSCRAPRHQWLDDRRRHLQRQPCVDACGTRTLGEVPGRKIAVLGDMRSWDRRSATATSRSAGTLAEVADVIYCVGELGRWIGDAAIQPVQRCAHSRDKRDRAGVAHACGRRCRPAEGLMPAGDCAGRVGGFHVTHALITGAVAAIIAALLGGPVIRFLRARVSRRDQRRRAGGALVEGRHPTMGGLLIFGVAPGRRSP
jgi:hypothetical protein